MEVRYYFHDILVCVLLLFLFFFEVAISVILDSCCAYHLFQRAQKRLVSRQHLTRVIVFCDSPTGRFGGIWASWGE